MIRRRKDRDGLQVQVYAGRDPLTGRKRWVSRQIPGSGRAAMKQAKQIELSSWRKSAQADTSGRR
jgi:hypothetical protein